MIRCTIGLVLVGMAMTGTVFAQGFLGFRLLDLDGSNVRWAVGDDRPAIVTYGVVSDLMRFPKARNCAGIVPLDGLLATSRIDRADFDREVAAAFAMWERVANIEFRRTDDIGSAGILIGAQEQPLGHAYANVDYRVGPGKVREIDKSVICLNPDKAWKIGFGGSLAVYDLRYTIAHEIGHAIGLDHPDPADQLMSFKYHEGFRTPQNGDVEGAIRLYGRRQPAKSTSTQDPGPPRTADRPG